MESMRYASVFSQAFPHMAAEDAKIDGFYIPKVSPFSNKR